MANLRKGTSSSATEEQYDGRGYPAGYKPVTPTTSSNDGKTAPTATNSTKPTSTTSYDGRTAPTTATNPTTSANPAMDRGAAPIVAQVSAQGTTSPATTAETPAATPSMRTPTTTSTVTSSGRTYTSNFQPQTYTPTGIYDPANLQAYNAEREAQIRQLYADAQQSALAGLKTAYDQNLSDATAYRDQISPQYQQSMNALSAEYERQRRNNNMQAAANGLNTGAGSQMALAQSANYQANQAGLAAKENQALDEANRRLADLKQNYQNAIAEATANNNYKLAASLMEEYQNAYNRQLNIENTNYQRQQAVESQNYTRQWNEDERAYSRGTEEAARKAQYGDFSGYADLYGEDIARNMELTWAMQNPQIAYAAGKLSAEDYQALTGYAPSGAGSSMGTSGGTSNGSYSGRPNITVSSDGSSYTSDRYYNPKTGQWDKTPSGRIHYLNRIPQGRGYSASRDKAYRGAPGYLNEEGKFVTGWSGDTPYNSGDYDATGDYERATRYAQAYSYTGGDRVAANRYAYEGIKPDSSQYYGDSGNANSGNNGNNGNAGKNGNGMSEQGFGDSMYDFAANVAAPNTQDNRKPKK